MARFNPSTILSGYDSISKLNDNFSSLAALLERVYMRDGTESNSMLSNMDLNHFKIENVADGVLSSDAVNVGQLDTIQTAVLNMLNGTVPASGSFPALTRTYLASVLANTSNPAVLVEAGREGLFVYKTGNYASRVTNDPQQGLYVAPASDPTGTSGAWVRQFSGALSVKWFGAVGDGVTNDYTAINAMFTTAGALGFVYVSFPAGTYLSNSNLNIAANNLVINGRGATITSPSTANAAFAFSGSNITVERLGLTMTAVAGDPSPYIDISGSNVFFDSLIINRAATAHVPFYVRSTADRFRMYGCYNNWYGGINTFGATNMLLIGNWFMGPSPSALDDAIALKANVTSSRNIIIAHNYFENQACFVSIGSEIGTPGANDATYSIGVYNVQVLGNRGKACTTILFIKPGAVANDTRDGTVENVICSNNTLRDTQGVAFQRAIVIVVGRGARVFNVKGHDNIVVARASGTEVSGHKRVIEYWLASLGNNGSGASRIENVDVGVSYTDPYQGVANGAATPVTYDGLAAGSPAPGYPVEAFVNIQNDIAGAGSMSDIIIDRIRGDGCNGTGMSVSANLDNAVTIGRIRFKNVNKSAGGGGAGVSFASAVKYRNFADMDISMTAGTTFKAVLSTATMLGPQFVLSQSGAQAAVTGTTTETSLKTVTIPGGFMGPNGFVEIEAQWSGVGAGTKGYRVYFGGTKVHDVSSTNNSYTHKLTIRNQNARNSQIAPPVDLAGGYGLSTNPGVGASVNTGSDVVVDFRGILGTGSDTQTLLGYSVKVFPGA